MCENPPVARNFRDLSEAEILALAISLEEADGRIYADFSDGLRESYPASAAVFEEMQKRKTAIARGCSTSIAPSSASTSRSFGAKT
jgi:hypothetical protein